VLSLAAALRRLMRRASCRATLSAASDMDYSHFIDIAPAFSLLCAAAYAAAR